MTSALALGERIATTDDTPVGDGVTTHSAAVAPLVTNPVDVREAFEAVSDQLVGFRANTYSVKPVHVANGLFRVTQGWAADEDDVLNAFVFPQSADGAIDPRYAVESVYAALSAKGRIEAEDVTPDDVQALRVMLKRVLGADAAVFEADMQSFSAGASELVTTDRIAQDGGELVAAWWRGHVPALHALTLSALQDPRDTISLLCRPLLGGGAQTAFAYEKSPDAYLLAPEVPPPMEALRAGLAHAGDTLARHLAAHPNKLARLRGATAFACFVLVRYLTALELGAGLATTPPPLLLDFTGTPGALRHASQVSYRRALNAVGRFYAWAFGRELQEVLSAADLLGAADAPPSYGRGKPVKSKCDPGRQHEIWREAVDDARAGADPFEACGQAMFDVIAHDDRGNPVPYLQGLALRAGLAWPPNNDENRYFSLSEDMLETLVRGAVAPGESVDLPTLQERFWNRYGVVIGGRPDDDMVLEAAGIYQADADATAENRRQFAAQLASLDCATLLADGVLHVRVRED